MTDKIRCTWPTKDPIYMAYHDEEWGVPEYNSQALWEKFVLDGFQAGLSWITILKKRDNFRAAFANFDIEKVAQFDDSDIQRLLNDAGIIRSRLKIEAAIDSARLTLKLRDSGIEFCDFIWEAQDNRPLQNHFEESRNVPAQTKASVELSKRLKSKGYRFCGPVITYAFMQAVGMVNDHLTGCFRHEEVKRLSLND